MMETASTWARSVTLLALIAALALLGIWLFPVTSTDPSAPFLRVIRGVSITLILAVAVGVVVRRQLQSLPLAKDEGASEEPVSARERRHHDARWFVHLRWLAAAVALGLITCAGPEPRWALLGWWTGLVVANLCFEAALDRWHRYEFQILLQAFVDLIVLTGFLNASGGLENPLYTVFAFHVIVGRILLPPRKALLVTLMAMTMFSLMVFGEYLHFLPHRTNFFFPHPEATPPESPGHGGHDLVDGSHASFDLFFVLGRFVPFLSVLVLTDFFVSSVMRRLRTSEHGLERAARTAVLERERLEGVVDAAGVGMMQLDPSVAVRWFSARSSRWLGWDRDVLGTTCPLLDAEDGCPHCVVRSAVETGNSLAAERRETGIAGRARIFRHSSSPIRDDSGEVVQVVEVIEDITSRRALEEEALRSEKLSVLGRMAAGIAHEVGNPLASIATRLQLLEQRQDSDFVAQSVGVLRQQIERISRIVRGVSHFGRVGRREKTAWELNALVAEMAGVIELDPRARKIRLIRRLEEPSPRVCAVRDQIGQIVLNLLLNAVEASPSGSSVTITSFQVGEEVRLTVDDEGPGVDPEHRDHLFEPFFSTKNDGSGLGLSISYGFAAAHGGRIELEQRNTGGARFTVILPAHRPDEPCGPSPEKEFPT